MKNKKVIYEVCTYYEDIEYHCYITECEVIRETKCFYVIEDQHHWKTYVPKKTMVNSYVRYATTYDEALLIKKEWLTVRINDCIRENEENKKIIKAGKNLLKLINEEIESRESLKKLSEVE